MSNFRIPRKLKKKRKTEWEIRTGRKYRIIRSTIKKDYWGNSPVKVWSCMADVIKK